MIELFSADTPNGKKISIMLEEINFNYKVTKVNLSEGEQFNPEFRKISPFSKIPVIIDHDNKKESIFESGAILMYLGEKSNKFYDKENRLKINQWLMGQMGYVGPMIGQHHQFHHYNSGKSEFGEKRYFNIAKSIYHDLDDRDQFKPEFIKISPFSKIPVIIDHDNNESIFESGAILMYLGEKSGKLYDQSDRLKTVSYTHLTLPTILLV